MKRFIEGADRGQSTLFPECVEDWIGEDNPVRVIDVLVDGLDLAELGFGGVDPEATGRPSYHPSMLLKLYIYGYLNQVQSSRRLEREAGRNVEVMWLLGRLAPDHKTIADFRKDNGLALRKVCARFVELCREMGLLATASVAIDGSKFKAVNNRDKNFTRAKVERRRAQLEESVARYLSQLDTADRQEPTEALAAKVTRLSEKLTKLKEEMGKLAVYERQMLASPDQQISLTDPDSRSMALVLEGAGAYTAVNGERTIMNEGDFIITPPWAWHDHGNQSDKPIFWLDGLDIPVVQFLDASFAEHLDRDEQPIFRPVGDSDARYGANLLPIDHKPGGGSSPVFNYPYARTRQALERLRPAHAWDP